MSDDAKFVPAILDREIHSSSQDEFGHRHFASMLKGLIESSVNKPPFSIGVLGRWGSGKSSIKSLYLKELEDDTRTNSGHTRSAQIIPITFNAWRFGGENIRRALLRHVYVQLGGDRETLDDALFRSVQNSQQEKKDTWDFWKEVLESWGWSLLQAALVVALFIVAVIGVARLCEVTDQQVIGWLLGTSAMASVLVIKFLLSSDRFPRRTLVTRIDNPVSASEIFEEMLLDQLEAFKKGKTKLKSGKHCERLVIFIDDLDRLSPEEMIGGLDAVRTFMELPTQRHNLGIVFVISCDEDRIAEALADRRQRGVKSDMPGAVFTQTDAHRFLDRIFQFRMEIPPFPKRDMRSFAENYLRNSFPDLLEDLEEAETSLETLTDRMIHVGVGTPRNALQIVNCFIQSWWIAKKREIDGPGSERPGGLQSGAITKFPLALGAICALRVDFPDFYRHLQKHPSFIQHFSDVFIRDMPLDGKPDEVQALLGKYASEGKLRDGYRPLRQYISSIQGVPWPKTLRPILFFSQDAVTRKYGDRALVLNEKFVSGDVTGVLEVLGRDHDTKLLSGDDMRLLNGLTEELSAESESRKNNAAFVLASLTERFPADSAHLLVSPLASQLGDSPQLRWRLGVSNIGKVIGAANPSDKRMVASRLIDDLLKPEGRIAFSLPTLESPSLDEAMAMCDAACSIVLDVHRDHGLEVEDESHLLEWMEDRRVQTAGGEQFLPFLRFEEWMKEHEDRLLPLYGVRYPKQISKVLQGEHESDLRVDDVVRRSRVIFDEMLESGEESRPELWDLLTDYITHGDANILSFAAKYLVPVVRGEKRPDASAFNGICTALGTRLQSPPSELNFDDSARTFISLVTARTNEISDELADLCSALVTTWGNDVEKAEYAVALASPLGEELPQVIADVVTDWTSRLLTNLPIPCFEWMARSYGSILDDGQRNQIVTLLNPIHSTDSVTDAQGERHSAFIGHLDDQSLQETHMQSHLTSVFTQIGSRHANPKKYLNHVFPVVPLAIKHVNSGTVASMIAALFPNVQDRPHLFGWLHGQMKGAWPEPSDDMSGYDPVQLFDQAVEVILSSAAADHMSQALESISSMVVSGIVAGDKNEKVVDCACLMWQHDPEIALKVLQQHQVMPTISYVADMTAGLTEDEADSESLAAAWSHIAEQAGTEDSVEVAKQLVQQPSIGPDDQSLRIWIELTKSDAARVLSTLLSSDDLSDGQRKRIWLQIEHSTDLSDEFFLDVIPSVASLDDCPETVSEMLDYGSQINERFSDEQKRFNLGTVLVSAFRKSSSAEAKGRLVRWLNDLSVDAVVRTLSEGEPLSEEEIEILRPVLEKNRYWKKIEKHNSTSS